MRIPLLKAKLARPAANLAWVTRPQLLQRLDEGAGAKLTLVSTPAGYGKSTLISAWADRCGMPVAWLSLDATDNDLARFITYLVAALQAVQVGGAEIWQSVLNSLPSFQPQHAGDWMGAVIEVLQAAPGRFALVLDDYHQITNPEIHQAVNDLVEYHPPEMMLVILTRVDPPLAASKWRARGQLNELRQADLRFTLKETGEFMRRLTGSELSAAEADVLYHRTEGWVAGLQMACLALQGALALESKPTSPGIPSQTDETDTGSSLSRMVASFGGSHEYIVDFFATEVLSQQTVEIRSFLMQTAILEPLCGELCNAVTGRSDGQVMLEQLHKANLFLVPLDQERHWYRYHPLFSDLLCKQLVQEAPESTAELHRRASLWYEQQGEFDLAFQHACSTGDRPRVAWLVNEYSEFYWMKGEYGTLFRWIENLSKEQLDLRPELIVGKAIILGDQEKYAEAKRLLAQVEQDLYAKRERRHNHAVDVELEAFFDPDHYLGLVSIGYTHLAFLQHDLENVLQHGQKALEQLSRFHLTWDIPWRCDLLISLGHALWITGDHPRAVQMLEESLEMAKSYQHHDFALRAAMSLALMCWKQGQPDEAWQICQEGLAYAELHGLNRVFSASRLSIIKGLLLCERGDLEYAAGILVRALEISQKRSDTAGHYFAQIALSRLYRCKGEEAPALECDRAAESLASHSQAPMWLTVATQPGFVREANVSVKNTPTAALSLTFGEALEALSEREMDVLRLMAQGLSNKQIAARLHIALRTVKFHSSNIYAKLGAERRTEAILRARELRMLE